MPEARIPLWRNLYLQVLVAIALGVLVGWLRWRLPKLLNHIRNARESKRFRA